MWFLGGDYCGVLVGMEKKLRRVLEFVAWVLGGVVILIAVYGVFSVFWYLLFR